jgi:YNFM family putative membrane transporter
MSVINPLMLPAGRKLSAGIGSAPSAQPSHATQDLGQPLPRYPAATACVLLLMATAMLVLTQLYAAIPLAGPVGDYFGGDAVYVLSTMYSLCYATGFLFWGPIADLYGNKRIMVIGLVGLIALTTACAFASSLPMLAVSRGLQGFLAASFPPTALAYLAATIAPRFRATAIGAVSTSFLISGILVQLFALSISQYFGWNWVFIISAIALACTLPWIVLLITEPAREPRSSSVLGQFVAALRLTKRPSVVLLCAAHVTLLLSFVAMYAGLNPHLATLGLDPSQTLLMRLVGLPGMFAALLVGPLSRRLRLAVIARAGIIVGAFGLLLEALLSSTLSGTAAASLVFVTGISLAVSAMISLFGEAATPHRGQGWLSMDLSCSGGEHWSSRRRYRPELFRPALRDGGTAHFGRNVPDRIHKPLREILCIIRRDL